MENLKPNNQDHSKTKRVHLSPLTLNRNGTFSNVTLRSESTSKIKTKSLRKSVSFNSISEIENFPPNTTKNNNTKSSYDDRFIPKPIKDIAYARSEVDGQFAEADEYLKTQISNMCENATEKFNVIRSCVSENDFENCRILAFSESAPKGHEAGISQAVNFIRATATKPKWKLKRYIPSMPERVLDAPELENDYYLNLIHWGGDNCLSIGLGPSVFILQANTGKISKICLNKSDASESSSSEYVSGVKWAGYSSGACLAVGYSSGNTRLYDVKTGKLLRTLFDTIDRVPSLSWNENILSCGSRRGVIVNYDVRVQNARISTLVFHSQEVCGLDWSPDGLYLASGGNDNDVCVWDKIGAIAGGPVLHRLIGHTAAVKALTWHPQKTNILITGGGLADHTLNFWNVSNGLHLSSLPTNSQISGVAWNPRNEEFVTSHGHPQNQLTLWSYPSMEIGANLISHTDRVLGLTLSPDGTTVASIGADETVRLWKCFDIPQKSNRNEEANSKAQFAFN